MRIEIRHDKLHKTWHRLSVSFHHLALIEGVIVEAHKHRIQYAADNQMNADMLAVRIIDADGNEIWRDDSSATHNRT